MKRQLKGYPENARIVLGSVFRKFGIQHSKQVEAEKLYDFREFPNGNSRVPVRVVTPDDGHYMTTFFDVDALSPSGRFLATTKVPFIWRIPSPGDVAQIAVIDLSEGRRKIVAKTSGWGSQLGANVQWGADDDTLFFNDVQQGVPVGIRLNLKTGERKILNGTIYGLDPKRRFSFSPNLDFINAGIPGYGVPENIFAPKRQPVSVNENDGIWRTCLRTGETSLFLSLKQLVDALPVESRLDGGDYYAFNTKINQQGTRGFVVIFSKNVPGRAGWPPQLMTFDIEGGNVSLAMPDALWKHGGHHPSWAPDGEHITMNLRSKGERMRFVKFRYDGRDLVELCSGAIGGGHPSLHPSGDFLLTDAYVSEPFIDKEGRVPLRLLSTSDGRDDPLCWVNTKRLDGPRRIDPHPVWSRDGSKVIFNGVVNGMRQVMIADVRGVL